MVGRPLSGRLAFTVIALALILSLTAHFALAQDIGEEGDYAIQEEYRIELNEVGDAHITDTLTYDESWFEEYGFLFEENPNLLSRRYRADSNVGEVEGFDADIDSGDATITVSFDTPGLAYNLDEGWTVFGYGDYELVDEGPGEVVLQAAWTVTNEFSLFEPMSLDEKVVIVLPDGAENAGYDEATGAIQYELGYTAGGGGTLAENKTLFTIIFAVIMALALILLLYLFTRRTTTPAALEAGTAGEAVAGTPVPPATALQAQGTAPAGVNEQKPRFCKKCGHPRGSHEERFCRKCGAPYE